MDGVDFRFVGVSEFQAMLGRGELAEWATVHGNLYGTRARSLEDALAVGRDVLLTSTRRAPRSSANGTRTRCSSSSWRRR